MHRFYPGKTSPTLRAALKAGGLLLLVLVFVWAVRSVASLPAFLPHVGRGGITASNFWEVALGFTIIALAFGTPLFLLFRRNTQLAEAKQSLQAREDEFRAYAEAGSDWLWATDSGCHLTSLVGGSSAEFEAARKRILGKTVDQVVGPNQIISDAARWRRFYDDIVARRPFRNFEINIRDRRGKNRHLSLSAIPTYDAIGVFQGYRGVTTDITERKEAELALRESEQRFSDFASSASDWFWETDADHRLTFTSSRIEDTLGIGANHSLGRTRFELAAESDREGRPDVWQRHRDDLDSHRPFRNFEYETVIKGARRTILTSGVPVFDAEGLFTGYRGSAADVTEHRRAEREALEYLRQFRVLADNLPILIANFDADWRFLYVNHTGEVWFDRPREEILGRTFAEVAGADLMAASAEGRRQALAGETVRQETVTTFPDGKTRAVQRTILPDFQPGEPMRIHVMAIDVTEQRQLEEQVRQNLKMEALGNLTGGVAHDFNNLLLAIQGNLEFLQEEPLDEALEPFVRNALRGVERAADLTRRLLTFSRRQPLAPRAVDVGALVVDMEELLRRTLEARIDLRIDADGAPLVALIDPGQLENAILNLAINARDAMPDGGVLTVRIRQTDVSPPAEGDHPTEVSPPSSYVCVEVEDDGSGMADSVREHAFEPFFTTKQVGHGTGLGLAMVHGFVTQSGGFARIDTEIGAGTTIRLYLPFAKNIDVPAEAADAQAAVISGGGTALLIEDNEMVRQVAERHLADLGYDVVCATGAADAEAVFAGPRPIDLVLSDLVLGGETDGFALAERARTRWPAVTVVLMSGYSDLVDNREAAERLDARLLAKPFSRATLAEAIAAPPPPIDAPADVEAPRRAAG